jgi:uncharacterized protein (DUF2141 family)
MKTLLLSITLSITSFFLTAQTNNKYISEGITIKVTIPIKSTEGTVLIGLHNETTFMKAPLVGLESTIKDGKAEVTFENIHPGIYGIMVLHDKNNNRQMDFDSNGMPLESYGTSNNVMAYGPPLWQDVKFEVFEESIEMEIRL